MKHGSRITFSLFVFLLCGFGAGFTLRAILQRPLARNEADILRAFQPAQVQQTNIGKALPQKLLLKGTLRPCEASRVRSLLVAWLEADSGACLNYLDSTNAIGLLGEELIVRVLRESTEGAIPTLIRTAQVLSDRDMADILFKEAFRIRLESSPEDAFTLLASMPQHLRDDLSLRAIEASVKRGGAEALRLALQSNALTRETADRGFEMLARTDPRAAIRLFSESSFGGPKAFSIGLAWEVAKSDPNFELQWLRSRPATRIRDPELARALANQIVAKSATVEDVKRELASNSARSNAYAGAGEQLVTSEPELAAELIAAIPGQPERARAYSLAAGSLAAQDPKQALQWISSAATPFDRATAVAAISAGWFSSDSTAALAYAMDHIDDFLFQKALAAAIGSRIPSLDRSSANKDGLSFLKNLDANGKTKLAETVGPLLSETQRNILLEVCR